MKRLISSVAILTVLMASCNENDSCRLGVEKKDLSITASIGAVTKSGEKSAWGDGDKLGVFVTSGQLGNAYNTDETNSNVPFTYSPSGWSSKKIALDNKPATVFAYYPFKDGNLDGQIVPVETASQTDYMYGVGTGPASALTTTSVNINMKHVLTQVVFKMKKNNYTGGAGKLTKVVISNNAASTVLKTSGTMNISSGQITEGTAGSVSLIADHSISGTESSFSSIVMPVAATTGEDLKVTFTIDGKDLYHVFVTGTEWKAGYRNIYSFTLKDNDLQLGGEDGSGVTIEPWDDTDKGSIPLIPVI